MLFYLVIAILHYQLIYLASDPKNLLSKVQLILQDGKKNTIIITTLKMPRVDNKKQHNYGIIEENHLSTKPPNGAPNIVNCLLQKTKQPVPIICPLFTNPLLYSRWYIP